MTTTVIRQLLNARDVAHLLGLAEGDVVEMVVSYGLPTAGPADLDGPLQFDAGDVDAWIGGRCVPAIVRPVRPDRLTAAKQVPETLDRRQARPCPLCLARPALRGGRVGYRHRRGCASRRFVVQLEPAEAALTDLAPAPPNLAPVAIAAERVGKSPATVRRWITTGALNSYPAASPTRGLLVDLDQLDALRQVTSAVARPTTPNGIST